MAFDYKPEKVYANRNTVFYEGSCGNCRELAIRFIGCNFRCSFCYAWKYSWPPDYSSLNTKYIRRLSIYDILNKIMKSQLNFEWIRITGGETIWNQNRTNYLIDLLNEFNSLDYNGSKNIIIQTNGSLISNFSKQLNILHEFDNLKIIMEVSIKGTNRKEFELLNEPFNNKSTINNSLFDRQLEGYWKLKDLFNKSRNIHVCARLGIGHHRNSITFIYPDTYPGTSLTQIMFHDSRWSKEFESVYRNEIQTNGYLAVEDINVNEGGLGSIIHLYIPAIVRMLNRKIIIDRSNKINEYGYFKHEISNGRVTPFPQLDEHNLRNIIKQYNEYCKMFKFTPAQKYLLEFSSLT